MLVCVDKVCIDERQSDMYSPVAVVHRWCRAGAQAWAQASSIKLCEVSTTEIHLSH